MLLAAALIAVLLAVPAPAGASMRPRPPSAAAFERATREALATGAFDRRPAPRSGGVGTGPAPVRWRPLPAGSGC